MDDNSLWITMEGRLRQHNLSIDDIVKADLTTRGRLFSSLGFDPSQETRLVNMSQQRLSGGGGGDSQPPTPNTGFAVPFGPGSAAPKQHNSIPGTPSSAAPLGGGGLPAAASPPPNRPAFPGPGGNTNNNMPSPAPANNRAGPGGNNAGQTGGGPRTSAVQGLTIDGDNMIARCSVYPNLPAEYWCCACNVLVSSRCHVQGVHKDHPFITLRLAAESHVRDVAAWNERARTQLNVTSSVLNNLRHAETLMNQTAAKQYQELDEAVQRMMEDLMQWKETLRRDIDAQIHSQQSGIQHTVQQTEALHALYSGYLSQSEPLMTNVPPVDETDKRAEDWALRVLDLVSKLKHVNSEAIPMPKIMLPSVTCLATPATNMELLKCVSTPVGVRLPDIVDPGYFNFPHPAMSARLPFSLVSNEDTVAKGILIYNGRTLTRAQDVIPSQALVLGSQVFYNGTTSWEVHIDRMGTGTRRILAGLIVNGSDGQGVVWDNTRIVGPNDGEVRNLDDRYQWRPGTILRFHLELEPPQCFLNCFFDRDGVARIPLPSNGSGWCPAFSVFGPQDQVTIVPTASATSLSKPEKRSLAASGGDTVALLEKQDHMISSLQQQLNAMHSRLDHESLKHDHPHGTTPSQYPPNSPQQGSGGTGGGNNYNYGGGTPSGATNAVASPQGGDRYGNQSGNYSGAASPPPRGGDQQPPPTGVPRSSVSPAPQGPTGHNYVAPRGGPMTNERRPALDAYSPELRHLMRFVDSVN